FQLTESKVPPLVSVQKDALFIPTGCIRLVGSERNEISVRRVLGCVGEWLSLRQDNRFLTTGVQPAETAATIAHRVLKKYSVIFPVLVQHIRLGFDIDHYPRAFKFYLSLRGLSHFLRKFDVTVGRHN